MNQFQNTASYWSSKIANFLCHVYLAPTLRRPNTLVHWCCWLGGRKGIWSEKTEWWGAGMIISLERSAGLHMAQLMPLPLTVSCFSKIQIGFTFLVSTHPEVLEKGPLNARVLRWPHRISLRCLVVWKTSNHPYWLADISEPGGPTQQIACNVQSICIVHVFHGHHPRSSDGGCTTAANTDFKAQADY